MSTSTRKERRSKELIKAGREAVADRAQLQSQIAKGAKEIDRLHVIERQASNLRNELSGARHKIIELQLKNERMVEHSQALVHDLNNEKQTTIGLRDHVAELKADLKKTNVFHNTIIDRLHKEIARLKAEDKEAKPLRRRLAKAKDDLAEKNTLISQLRLALDGM